MGKIIRMQMTLPYSAHNGREGDSVRYLRQTCFELMFLLSPLSPLKVVSFQSPVGPHEALKAMCRKVRTMSSGDIKGRL